MLRWHARASDYKGATHVTELNVLLEHCFMLRRRKADVLKDLPARIRSRVYLDLGAPNSDADEATLAALGQHIARGGVDSSTGLFCLFGCLIC